MHHEAKRQTNKWEEQSNSVTSSERAETNGVCWNTMTPAACSAPVLLPANCTRPSYILCCYIGVHTVCTAYRIPFLHLEHLGWLLPFLLFTAASLRTAAARCAVVCCVHGNGGAGGGHVESWFGSERW